MSANPSTRLPRRTLLGGALGIGAAGALTACGSNRGVGSKSGDDGGLTLNQWYHQYGEAGTHDAALRYAEEYSEADVKVTWVPATGGYPQKLTTALSANEGPDCFEYHTNRSLVDSEQVTPLDDLIAETKDDFNPSDLESNSIDGSLYAIPMIVDPQMVYYRKSLFDAKGVQPPETLDDWIAAAAELTDDKVKGLFMGNDANSTVGAIINPLIGATGGTFLTPEHEVGIDFDTLGEALVKLRQFKNDKSLLLGAPQEWTNPDSLITQLCAMQWIGMWAVPQMIAAFPDDIGCFPLPGLTSSEKTVWKGGWAAMVNSASPNLEAAKAFTKWLWVDNVEAQQDWCLSYGFHIPPRKSVTENATALQEGVAAESVTLSNDYGFPADPNWTPAMGTALTDATTAIVGKGADPEKEFASAEKTITAELDKIFG